MYVKLKEGALEIAPINKEIDGNIIFNYNTDSVRLVKDGYKILIETNKPTDGQSYSLSYSETDNQIIQVWNLESTLEDLKLHANNILKESRVEYQGKLLSVDVVRDDVNKPNLVLSLDSSLDTRGNIEFCSSICKSKGEVYYYDKEGNGDWLSENELSQVQDKVINSVDLSFYITGKGFSEISKYSDLNTLKSDLDSLINRYQNLFNELYSKITNCVSYEEIKNFISNY